MRRPLFALAALLALAGCGPKMMPGTEIRDTEENRQLLDVIAAYKVALEARNVDRIVGLASPKFFETSGTPDGGDDYDFEGLKAKLKSWAEYTKAVRADIKVKAITVEGETARVRYFYDLNYQVPGEGVPIWKRDSDTKEMAFLREGGAWRIVSGI